MTSFFFKNRMAFRPPLWFAFLLLIPGRAFGAFFVGEGATGASLLKIPVAARATALGTTFTAAKGDIAAIEYNPAGLMGIDRMDINLTHLANFESSSLDSASLGFPFGPNIISQGKSDSQRPVQKWVFGSQFRTFKATDEERNEIGAKLGSFDISDRLFHLAIAHAVTETVSVGAGAKLMQSTLKSDSVTRFAGDIGLQWKVTRKMSLGTSLLNAGPSKAFIKEKDPLPLIGRLGGAYQWNTLLFLADLSEGRDRIASGSVGVEWNAVRFLQIRGGLLNHSAMEFTGGIGILFSELLRPQPIDVPLDPAERAWDDQMKKSQAPSLDVRLDYAIRSHAELGFTHTITLNIIY